MQIDVTGVTFPDILSYPSDFPTLLRMRKSIFSHFFLTLSNNI